VGGTLKAARRLGGNANSTFAKIFQKKRRQGGRARERTEIRRKKGGRETARKRSLSAAALKRRGVKEKKNITEEKKYGEGRPRLNGREEGDRLIDFIYKNKNSLLGMGFL